MDLSSKSEARSPTIVVGYDGSEPAKEALAVAVDLARWAAGSKIMVVCGQDLSAFLVYTFRGPIVEEQEYLQELEERVIFELEEAAKTVREAGVEVATVCTGEHPVDTMLTVAKDTSASLIVVGAKGSGALHDVVMGSTTMRLLHHSPIPVVVVPAKK
jgi:nucleotide-binding universal stress UspA family protein